MPGAYHFDEEIRVDGAASAWISLLEGQRPTHRGYHYVPAQIVLRLIGAGRRPRQELQRLLVAGESMVPLDDVDAQL